MGNRFRRNRLPFLLRGNLMEIRTGGIKPVECFKEGWELIKPDYWILFAITLVGVLIGSFTMYVLLGAMLCGIYYCFIRRIDGEKVEFEDLWKGFGFWLPGLSATIVIMVPVIIVYVIIYLPFVLAIAMGSKLSESELMGMLAGAFAIDAVIIVIMVCFHTLVMFTFQLIVDKGLGAFAAMKLSVKGVWANLGGVAGLFGVMFLLNIVSALTCVGIYFAIPIMMAGTTVAYRRIFPRETTANTPTPPSYYQ